MAATPNYSGMFLRGYGSQTSSHYNNVTHASAGIGTMQGDSIREISANFGMDGVADSRFNNVYYEGLLWLPGGAFAFANNLTNGGNALYTPNKYGKVRVMNFYASRVTPVANEVRPVNKAVRYLIRTRN